MLTAKRSPVFAGQGLHNAPRRAYRLRAFASTTRCQRSARGTVLMEPAVKPHLHKHSAQPAPQLKPLVRQPIRQKHHFTDSSAKVRQKQTGTADMQHIVKAAPAKGRHIAKQAINAGASASESVQQLVPNKAFPFIKQTGHQTAEGLHKPIGLVLASAYLLGTVCHLSGTLTSVLHSPHTHTKALKHAFDFGTSCFRNRGRSKLDACYDGCNGWCAVCCSQSSRHAKVLACTNHSAQCGHHWSF